MLPMSPNAFAGWRVRHHAQVYRLVYIRLQYRYG